MKEKNKLKETVSFKLTDKQKKELNKVVDKLNLSKSEFIRETINNYIYKLK